MNLQPKPPKYASRVYENRWDILNHSNEDIVDVDTIPTMN
jgi:hypothetical protein